MNPTPNNPVPPDDLDGRFAAYFRRQLPDPFPAFRGMAVEPSLLAAARRSAGRSRLTLAASAAALLGLGLVLSSPGVRNRPSSVKAPAAAGTSLFDTSTASGAELLKQAGK